MNALTILEMVLVVILVFGAIPYVVWVVRILIKWRWRALLRAALIPVVWLGLFLGISKLQLLCVDRETFDCWSLFGPTLYAYDSERSFTGDGYSFAVYKLPAAIRERFLKADKLLTTEFPKHPPFCTDWSVRPWSTTPVAPDFKSYMDFALSEAGGDELKRFSEAARAALLREGSFYGSFTKVYKNSVHDIDLFIVDLQNDRIYFINFNT